MRTTVTLDADVWRAVEELRRHKGLGISEAMGKPKVPLDNIGEVLVLLEGDAHR